MIAAVVQVMVQMERAFWVALRFLTRIPAPYRFEPAPEDWGRAMLFFPLVGVLIGVVLIVFHDMLSGTARLLEAALLLTAWVLLTGGLHLDGLADTADAWIGGHGDRERTLEIMKDPRNGAAAIWAVALVLLMKFAALNALLGDTAWKGLLLAPVLGRAALLALFLTTPYVRPNGLGAHYAEHLPRLAAGWILLAVAVAVLLLTSAIGFLALLIVLAGVWLLRRALISRIGGTTGDTAGAACELAETAVLVVLAL